MGSGLLSADTQIHTQPSETHMHTHRAKVCCCGNVASFTDFFFEKGNAPPGKDLDGGDGGREKGLHIWATTQVPGIWRGGGVGRVKERGMSEHKSQRSQN